jgi:hypothetical protein
MRDEAVDVGTGVRQFAGVAHPDEVGRDEPAARFQFRNHVAPQIGGGRIAVQEQNRRAPPALVIGHAAVQDIDGFFASACSDMIPLLHSEARRRSRTLMLVGHRISRFALQPVMTYGQSLGRDDRSARFAATDRPPSAQRR